MTTVRKSVLVPYSADAMFHLVDRVEDYPDFLPWCSGSAVLARDAVSTHARIDIQYRGVRQSFTTMNRKEGQEWMHIALVEGPFRKLDGHWHFQPLDVQASKVELLLEYAFASAVLEGMVGPVFDYIANTLMERFVGHADNVFSKPGSGG